MARIGDVVLIPALGDQHHAIIGQAEPKGYWVQNLVTGALPIAYRPYPGGWLPREMTVITRAIEWSKS